MKRFFIFFFITLFGNFAEAQYISEIIEYTPAPGQFINTDSYGSPQAAQSIIGTVNGTVSLGAFGGYIIFKFENSAENDPNNPYGIDFTVFGNPASSTSSEPGIVSVMKDENNNGLPDDIWYELAGSDYFFSNTIHNYQITYTNPQQETATDVPWTDNTGNSGFVYANDYHTQAYYPNSDFFPNVNQNSYSFDGTKIIADIDTSNTSYIKSYQRAFGYSDNKPRGDTNSLLPDNPYTSETEGMGGDAFDISWAVDENGNYVNLDKIDFIKIHCAVNDNLLWLGEVSTEIAGAKDIAPDASVSGTEDMVVIKDLPPILYTGTAYQLEILTFHNGRLTNNAVDISVNLPGSSVDTDNILNASQSGTLTITAALTDNPDIFAQITRTVSEPEDTKYVLKQEVELFPNPAKTFFQIKHIDNAKIEISDSFGRIIKQMNHISENEKINTSDLSPGIFFVTITSDKFKLLKKLIVSE